MKKIGIVGVSSEGAALCYKTICSESSVVLGQHHHPEIMLHHHSFASILALQQKGDWKGVANILLDSIRKLASIGADFAIIPGNSVHYAFDLIKKKSPIPVLSIVETACDECNKNKFKKVAVLGVGFTMSGGLFEAPLKKRGITPILPTKAQQDVVNKLIYKEIVPGKWTNKTTRQIVTIIKTIEKSGCDAVILACTELPIVITKENSPLPLVDTTRLLAKKALEYAVS